jgi:hypothetical protein
MSHTITFSNAMPFNDNPVTFLLSDAGHGALAPLRFTVQQGSSITHPVGESRGPWAVQAILPGLADPEAEHFTVPTEIDELPATVKVRADYIAAKLDITHGMGRRPGGARSVLDRAASWMPVSDEVRGKVGHEIDKFKMETQSQTQWCWAAVATSLSKFYDKGSSWTQCKLANWRFGSSSCDCCAKSVPTACNKPSSTPEAIAHVGCLNKNTLGALAFDKIKAEIDAEHPFALSVHWNDGGGHAVAVSGYQDGSTRKLTVNDPWFGTSIVHLDRFPEHYQGGGTWYASYTTPTSKLEA